MQYKKPWFACVEFELWMPWQSELIVLIPAGRSISSNIKKKSFSLTSPLVITELAGFKMYFEIIIENLP